ncbi:HET domain-containing protein [Fusarium sp. LHS14.1]|nr:HET domain-containing protein [Fusarium sp. LHS14.1]
MSEHATTLRQLPAGLGRLLRGSFHKEFQSSNEREVDVDIPYLKWETFDQDTSGDEETGHESPAGDIAKNLLDAITRYMVPDSMALVLMIRALGELSRKNGRYDLAESLLRTAQHELDRIAGRLHEDTVDTVSSLAIVLAHQGADRGKFKEAGKLTRKAIRGYSKLKGPRSAATMRLLREISCVYTARSRQLLQQNPVPGSTERKEVINYTKVYISICQELSMTEASMMLGSLGRVLAWAGSTANATFAFQWKYVSAISTFHSWNVCNICTLKISSLPLHICLDFLDVEVCSLCYDLFYVHRDTNPLGSISRDSAYEFLNVEAREPSATENADIAREFNIWLRDVAIGIQRTGTQPSLKLFFIGTEDDMDGKAYRSYLERCDATLEIQLAEIKSRSECGSWKYSLETDSNQHLESPIVQRAAALIAEAQHVEGSSSVIRRCSKGYSVPPGSIYEALPLEGADPLIRLLELLPGDTTDPLVCNLVVRDQSESPIYEAVSWTWGKPQVKPTQVVQVNGTNVHIRPNLHACLLAFRHRSDSRMLWADAICINQDDDQEKSDQVARMSSIYHSASGVLIYLGEASEAEAALFRYFNRENREEPFETSLERLGMTEQDLFEAHTSLYGREWWSRIWIQQEFALPQEDPTFYLGRVCTKASHIFEDERDAFTTKFGGMEVEKAWRDRKTSHPGYIEPLKQMIGILLLRHMLHDPPKNLGELFSSTKLSECSDPRDLIFGRYIFMQTPMREIFRPDYSLTTESLFEKAAIWLLRIEIGMKLFWLYPNRLSPESPSWVPNFSKGATNFNLTPSARDEWEWYEKHDLDPIDIYHGILRVRGHYLDTVSHVFSVGGGSLLHSVRQFLLLEATLPEIVQQDAPQRRHPLSDGLPGLEAKPELRHWTWSMNTPIHRLMPYQGAINIVFDATQVAYQRISELFDKDPPWDAGFSATARLRQETVEVVERFHEFRMSLVVVAEAPTGLLWPSLCNFKNLIAQIQHLRTPKRAPSPFNEASRNIADALNRMILDLQVSDLFLPVNVDDDDAKQIPSASNPSYEELQTLIADCKFEEEVRFRAKTVLHIAQQFRSSVNEDGEWTGSGDMSQDKTPDQQKPRDEELFLFNRAGQIPLQTIFFTKQRLTGVGRVGVTDIRVGDQVVMLEDVLFPMVIRPIDAEFHEIVGYAVINGLDGRAFHDLKQDEKPPRRVFKLK